MVSCAGSMRSRYASAASTRVCARRQAAAERLRQQIDVSVREGRRTDGHVVREIPARHGAVRGALVVLFDVAVAEAAEVEGQGIGTGVAGVESVDQHIVEPELVDQMRALRAALRIRLDLDIFQMGALD